jgi:hypothetical protein
MIGHTIPIRRASTLSNAKHDLDLATLQRVDERQESELHYLRLLFTIKFGARELK